MGVLVLRPFRLGLFSGPWFKRWSWCVLSVGWPSSWRRDVSWTSPDLSVKAVVVPRGPATLVVKRALAALRAVVHRLAALRAVVHRLAALRAVVHRLAAPRAVVRRLVVLEPVEHPLLNTALMASSFPTFEEEK